MDFILVGKANLGCYFTQGRVKDVTEATGFALNRVAIDPEGDVLHEIESSFSYSGPGSATSCLWPF